MTTQTFSVSGLTCEHCVRAVEAEVGALAGVARVDVELNPGGVSTVSVQATAPVSEPEIAAALDEAGDYELT